jgi:ACS family hexuronate transporter-like MFS transporter
MTPARRRWLLTLLILAGILNYIDRQIIAVLKPVIERDLHWNDQDYGLLASAFQFAAAIAYLGVGGFVDRVGLKWAMPLAVGTWSLAAAAHAVARGFAQFAGVRVALGVTEAVYTPAAVKTIAVVYRTEERGLAVGALNAANSLGAIVTPLAAPLVAAALGWRAAFLVTGALGLAWAGAWFATMSGHLPTPAPAPKPLAGAATQPPPQPKVGWLQALRDRRTWAVVGAKALSDQVWWLLLFWTPDLFHRVFHLTTLQSGVPLAVIYSFAGVGALGGGWLSGRLLAGGMSLDKARKRVMLACGILVTPVFLVLYVQSYWLAVGLLSLALFAHQAFSTNLFALITDITPSRRIGSVTSLAAFAGNMAGMSILALVGLALSHGGSYLPFFIVISCAYLLALGWIQLLVPRLAPAEAD